MILKLQVPGMKIEGTPVTVQEEITIDNTLELREMKKRLKAQESTETTTTEDIKEKQKEHTTKVVIDSLTIQTKDTTSRMAEIVITADKTEVMQRMTIETSSQQQRETTIARTTTRTERPRDKRQVLQEAISLQFKRLSPTTTSQGWVN